MKRLIQKTNLSFEGVPRENFVIILCPLVALTFYHNLFQREIKKAPFMNHPKPFHLIGKLSLVIRYELVGTAADEKCLDSQVHGLNSNSNVTGSRRFAPHLTGSWRGFSEGHRGWASLRKSWPSVTHQGRLFKEKLVENL